MALIPCTSCRRHVRDDSACPFCGAAVSPAIEESPRILRGALMTIASAGFAASLGACYGAPRYYQETQSPPPRPPPPMQTIAVEGDAVAACDKAIAQAKKNGCDVQDHGGGRADIRCKDLDVSIAPTFMATPSGIELRCREPYDTCRSGVEKLISPAPPIEPIPPPP